MRDRLILSEVLVDDVRIHPRVCIICLCGFTSTKPSREMCPDCTTRRETIRSESSAQCIDDPSPGAPYRGNFIPHRQFMEGLRWAVWPPNSVWRTGSNTYRINGPEWDGNEKPPTSESQKLECLSEMRRS